MTPQAVSKWERDNGLPDIMVLSGIASVLGVSADTLLGRDEAIVENGDILAAADIKANLTSEPLALEFGANVIYDTPFLVYHSTEQNILHPKHLLIES